MTQATIDGKIALLQTWTEFSATKPKQFNKMRGAKSYVAQLTKRIATALSLQ
jgi:hypothetical protein